MLIAELVPQRVEFAIMWPMHDMAEFVKHRVSDLLDREELVSVAWIAKPQEDLLAPIYIQSCFFNGLAGGRYIAGGSKSYRADSVGQDRIHKAPLPASLWPS